MPEPLLTDDLIEARFRELRGRNEAALIAYLTGGDPDQKSFVANSAAVIEAGADILEVGIPFSDPIADGPVIQGSSSRAIANGTTPGRILDSLKELSQKFPRFPFVILTYYNPIHAMGLEQFMRACEDSGVTGVVVPDLPVEESDSFRETALRHQIDTIYIAAPNTSPGRLARIVDKSKGFLYLVSLYGVTGPREHLSPEAIETVRRVKALSNGAIPIAVGFGIKQSDQVASLAKSGADGIIVGSALVDIVSKHLDSLHEARIQLMTTVSGLKHATKLRPV